MVMVYVYKCEMCGHTLKCRHPYKEKCPVCAVGEMKVISEWRVKR